MSHVQSIMRLRQTIREKTMPNQEGALNAETLV